MAGLLAPLAAGGAVALPAGGRFAAGAFWGDAARAAATWFTAVPTMHQILLSRGAAPRADAGAPRFRFARSCSSALAPATLEKVRDKKRGETRGMGSKAAARAARPPDAPPPGRSAVRVPRARGVRDDRGRAPDDVQPAPRGRPPQARHRRPPPGRRVPHHPGAGRARGAARGGGRGVHPRRQRDGGVQGQPRSQRRGVRPRLVPHGGPRVCRRGGVRHAHGAVEGADQPGRRKDLPPGSRRRPPRPPGRRGGRVLWRAGRQVRGSGGGGGRARGGRGARGGGGERARARRDQAGPVQGGSRRGRAAGAARAPGARRLGRRRARPRSRTTPPPTPTLHRCPPACSSRTYCPRRRRARSSAASWPPTFAAGGAEVLGVVAQVRRLPRRSCEGRRRPRL